MRIVWLGRAAPLCFGLFMIRTTAMMLLGIGAIGRHAIRKLHGRRRTAAFLHHIQCHRDDIGPLIGRLPLRLCVARLLHNFALKFFSVWWPSLTLPGQHIHRWSSPGQIHSHFYHFSSTRDDLPYRRIGDEDRQGDDRQQSDIIDPHDDEYVSWWTIPLLTIGLTRLTPIVTSSSKLSNEARQVSCQKQWVPPIRL